MGDEPGTPVIIVGCGPTRATAASRLAALQTQTAPEPAPGELPPFLNLSQHDTERYLLEAVSRSPLIDVRWQHTLVGLGQDQDGVTITAQTPAGPTSIPRLLPAGLRRRA